MFLLLCIYLVFIGLGLSDSLLGAAWPFMADDFGASVENAGILSFIISIGIIVASLNVWRMVRFWGTGKTALLGLGLIATALFGYSGCSSWILLCILSVPLGFGGGIIQTVFDNYVAEHYSARQMNWLQGSWGIGAVAAPYLVSVCSQGRAGWRGSYATIAVVEILIFLLVLFVLPKWTNPVKTKPKKQDVIQASQRKGYISVKKICMGAQFFLYCSVENMVMLWGASYLVYAKIFDSAFAAEGVSMFFLGITLGRFLGGATAGKIGNFRMVLYSVGVAVTIDLLLLPANQSWLILLLFTILGMGMAPIYPAMLHQTPSCFPEENLNLLMGIQVASAYVGITVIPPVFGKIFSVVSFSLLPVFQLLFLIGVLICVAYLNRKREM